MAEQLTGTIGWGRSITVCVNTGYAGGVRNEAALHNPQTFIPPYSDGINETTIGFEDG